MVESADSSRDANHMPLAATTKPLGQEELVEQISLADLKLLDDTQESLGKGSFGLVQKVRIRGTEQIYALKSMRKQDVIDGNLIEQVELEIQVQRKLKHPNVLRLHRHFEDAENVYLLLEFCAKGELYQLLRTQRFRRFPEKVACKYYVQVATGLHYLHTNSIVHRDIKPENLLVTHNDTLKIADFGWCAMTTTLRTTFCGTLDYLAPEMIQGRGHSHTLDIWSAGVLLYEMMVGRPPFQSTNHGQLIFKILSLELKFPAFIVEEAQDLVRRLVRFDPTDRLPLLASLTHPWVKLHVSKEEREECAASCGAELSEFQIAPVAARPPSVAATSRSTPASHVAEAEPRFTSEPAPSSSNTQHRSSEKAVVAPSPRTHRASSRVQAERMRMASHKPKAPSGVQATLQPTFSQQPQSTFSPAARPKAQQQPKQQQQHNRRAVSSGPQLVHAQPERHTDQPQQAPSYRPDIASPVLRVRALCSSAPSGSIAPPSEPGLRSAKVIPKPAAAQEMAGRMDVTVPHSPGARRQWASWCASPDIKVRAAPAVDRIHLHSPAFVSSIGCAGGTPAATRVVHRSPPSPLLVASARR